jgi:NAD(P)-dependent dehydrogenase (short-subunit alcohol dehydrogenase family)
MGRFSNKRVLITGGTNGIGLAGAKRIAKEGGKIIVTGVSQSHIDEAIRLLPSDSIVIHNDAEDPEAANELAKIVEKSGGIDGLWLNAGFANVAAIKDIDAGFFNHMVNINLRAPVLQLAKAEQTAKQMEYEWVKTYQDSANNRFHK